MNANQLITEITGWLRKAASFILLLLLVTLLVKAFGVSIPIKAAGHVELAYLAGAYWLMK